MDCCQILKLKRATGNQYNCMQDVCANPPEEPFKVTLWQYVTTTLAIILAMAATCIMLVVMHRRHRLERYEEIRDYCDEQIRLRQSVFGLQTNTIRRRD